MALSNFGVLLTVLLVVCAQLIYSRGSSESPEINPFIPPFEKLGPPNSSKPPPPPPVTCLVRCVAKCEGTVELGQCEQRCQHYGKEDLCHGGPGPPSHGCWPKCYDLGHPDKKEMHSLQGTKITNLKTSYDPEFLVQASWDQVEGATLFYVQVENEMSEEKTQAFTRNHSLEGLPLKSNGFLCGLVEVEVAVANSAGIGPLAKSILEKPKPLMSAKLSLSSLTHEITPFVAEDYRANGTLIVELEFSLEKWPFGIEDLEIRPIFHMITCAVPDMENAIPDPEFIRGNRSGIIMAKLSADLMYRRCRFLYAIDEVQSRHCSSTYHIQANRTDYAALEITCDNVQNSNCQRDEPIRPPVCGQIENLRFKILNYDSVDWTNPASNISVNITFVPNLRRTITKKPLYYVALYGHAVQYVDQTERTLLGVNMTDVIGRGSSCARPGENGECLEQTPNNSIVLDNLSMKL